MPALLSLRPALAAIRRGWRWSPGHGQRVRLVARFGIGDEALLAGILLARSLQYAHDRYEASYAAYLEELDAQRNLFAQDNDLNRIRQSELENRLALVPALGDGWKRSD